MKSPATEEQTIITATNESEIITAAIQQQVVAMNESIDKFAKREIDEMLLSSLAARASKEEINFDEMKIQTMYKMVEDVTVDIMGKQVQKKVLYLTNKQAALFDDEAMARCIQALDIGEPKFVIKLCASISVRSQNVIAHGETTGTRASEYFNTANGNLSSELDRSDESIFESQVLLFMRTCIIPLAKQTHALILIAGANDCYLGAALSDVALAEQARLGKNCPFTVLATVPEFEIHHKEIYDYDLSKL
jgi:hypothetical protein